MEAMGLGVGLLFFAVIMVVSIGGLVLWVVSLIECARTPDHVYRMADGRMRWWDGQRWTEHVA